MVLEAVVLPPPAPPAASTAPVLAPEPLLPFWPVAVASPVVDAAAPLLDTVLLLFRVRWIDEFPPAIAPPVARFPL